MTDEFDPWQFKVRSSVMGSAIKLYHVTCGNDVSTGGYLRDVSNPPIAALIDLCRTHECPKVVSSDE